MIFASKNLRHQLYNNQCLNPKYQDVSHSGQDQKLLHRKPFVFKNLLKNPAYLSLKLGTVIHPIEEQGICQKEGPTQKLISALEMGSYIIFLGDL